MLFARRRTGKVVKDAQYKVYRLFMISSFSLLAALVALSWAEFYMEPSYQQELMGLIAIVAGLIAAFFCSIAYLSIIWVRIRHFFMNGRK